MHGPKVKMSVSRMRGPKMVEIRVLNQGDRLYCWNRTVDSLLGRGRREGPPTQDSQQRVIYY